MKTFRTLKKESEGFYKEKGSKFISLAFPVTDTEQSLAILKSVKSKYHDARHHCYAYIIGEKKEISKSNDDGEPSHSAGDPILGQIRSYDLTNTMIVVVRYFGGTKLGVGGLINAYRTAAQEAIINNKIVEVVLSTTINLHYAYNSTNEAQRLINEFDIKIIDQEFGEKCSIAGRVPNELIAPLRSKVGTLAASGQDISLEISTDQTA